MTFRTRHWKCVRRRHFLSVGLRVSERTTFREGGHRAVDKTTVYYKEFKEFHTSVLLTYSL
jgi:hypothetical protein